MLFPAMTHNRFADRLVPHNAALILIDCQEGLVDRCSLHPGPLRNNILGLSQVARTHNLPVMVLVHQSLHHGALLPELAMLFTPTVRRDGVGLWENGQVREKIQALGRRDLIIAGVAQGPEFVNFVLMAQQDGYRVHVVADASTGGDLYWQRLAVAQMNAVGVTVTNWVAVMAELTSAGGTMVSGALEAVKNYLALYSAVAIQWGGDDDDLAVTPSLAI